MSLSNEELKKFWDIANGLRKNLDAAEYKHIVLGLVFLRYISDSFEGRRAELEVEFANPKSDSYKSDAKRRAAALEERDYYKSSTCSGCPSMHAGRRFKQTPSRRRLPR